MKGEREGGFGNLQDAAEGPCDALGDRELRQENGEPHEWSGVPSFPAWGREGGNTKGEQARATNETVRANLWSDQNDKYDSEQGREDEYDVGWYGENWAQEQNQVQAIPEEAEVEGNDFTGGAAMVREVEQGYEDKKGIDKILGKAATARVPKDLQEAYTALVSRKVGAKWRPGFSFGDIEAAQAEVMEAVEHEFVDMDSYWACRNLLGEAGERIMEFQRPEYLRG
jgi:hypothetical protein